MVDVRDDYAMLQDFRRTHGLPGEKAPSLTAPTTALLARVYTQSRHIYADLSSALHGQVFTVANFLPTNVTPIDPPAGQVLRVGVSDELIVEYSAYAIDLVEEVITQLVAYTHPAHPSLDDWESSRRKAVIAIGYFEHLRRPASEP